MSLVSECIELLKVEPQLTNVELEKRIGKQIYSGPPAAARKQLGIVRSKYKIGDSSKANPRAGQPTVKDRTGAGPSKRQLVIKIFQLADEVGGFGKLKELVSVLEQVEGL